MGCCYSNPEANAYVMDCTSRATVGISNIFLGYAILRYAAKEAGCERIHADGICGKRLESGLRASSLLTVMLTVGYLATAACLPLVGTLVDYTPRRRAVGLLHRAAR